MRFRHGSRGLIAAALASSALMGCAGSGGDRPALPPADFVGTKEQPGEQYKIGPLDQLNIFVWRNPELSAKVQVRPDGRITTPLVNDMPATGKTPAQLSEDMRLALAEYIKDPIVSVIVENFSGTYSQQVRIVGATEKPASLPYRANMTLLDAMIAVGGLNQYAAGNKARLVRYDPKTGTQKEYDLKISKLLKDGDASANVKLEPGDVIIIPESMF
ncbi:Polysaccharide export protein [Sphingomonas sp. EC-HK361]|uniref:XrtA/PEP-CTERM system exopolysaccharide export protein n=1 Tax=Sphingomonas sp. EC-HK361 TaxID=2038397 RepID=UPI0012578119|nr:XrtA/PEP-CTERM system exopolysaccharide export protein [Sphingomonas sp. EC-HK361]VVT03810.1 Polysaccharide export protein [Sphingomonas sp. EC-HK361]